MTSDESAKSAFQDRNSFNVARRSEEEVAAEIAARLSAWKQARSRDNLTPEPVSRPARPATGSSMGGSMIRPPGQMKAGPTPTGAPQPHRPARPLPTLGAFTDEWSRERSTPEEPVAEPRSAPEITSKRPPIDTAPTALNRAVPEAPSPSRPVRAFPFRADIPQRQKPASQAIDRGVDEADDRAVDETIIAGKTAASIDRSWSPEIETPEIETPEITAPAEIETPRVDSAPAQRRAVEQSGVKRARPTPRAASIPSPVIETWEDEEAAIAAAAIPKLAIPERLTVPPTARHAAGAGTGWATRKQPVHIWQR